jgi:hypothetical protein
MTPETLFSRFMVGLFTLLFFYGAGMMVVIIWVDESTGVKMLNGFASMFAGTLGFGSGFLLGRANEKSASS